ATRWKIAFELWPRCLWICGQRKRVVHKSTGKTPPATSGDGTIAPVGPPNSPVPSQRITTDACATTHPKQRRAIKVELLGQQPIQLMIAKAAVGNDADLD